ncbi:hypothetical protein AB0B66_41120 [Catellatospora sp. NPDC049111]|uniref:hypothetical protein n=1 Tax=Catellatospora sp. NPDC049111 TaxID=3155271 RepID=UPI0033FDE2A0
MVIRALGWLPLGVLLGSLMVGLDLFPEPGLGGEGILDLIGVRLAVDGEKFTACLWDCCCAVSFDDKVRGAAVHRSAPKRDSAVSFNRTGANLGAG